MTSSQATCFDDIYHLRRFITEQAFYSGIAVTGGLGSFFRSQTSSTTSICSKAPEDQFLWFWFIVVGISLHVCTEDDVASPRTPLGVPIESRRKFTNIGSNLVVRLCSRPHLYIAYFCIPRI